MSCVIPFPLRHQPVEAVVPGRATGSQADVPSLAARLQRLERIDAADEGKLEEIVDAEMAVLEALAATKARDFAEVAVKLATLLRRVEARGEDGLPEGEMALLRGAVRDLRRLGRRQVAAQA